MYTKQAELKAGIVVVIAVGVLLTLLWLSTGAESLFASHRTILLRFQQGYAAPEKGDPLFMNGFSIGQVTSVVQKEELRSGAQLTPKDRALLGLKTTEDGTAREIYVLAEARLPAAQKIPDGTTAEISVSVTGSRQLQLMPGRSTRDLTDEDIRHHPIATSSAGDLADVMRSIQELVAKVSDLVGSGDLVLADVRTLLKSLKDKVDSIDLAGIQANVLDASSSLKDSLATVKRRVDEIGERISDAASDVKAIAANGKTIVKSAGDDVNEILKTLKEVALELKDILDRAAPKVDAILDDVARAARGAAELGKEFQGLGPRLHAILGDAGAGLDKVLSRFAEVGHNLADASEDLRAHPWKLLNKPDEKEIAYENLRNAASNYVRAAQAMGEAADDLKTLQARQDLGPDDQKRLVAAALARLQADLSKYAAAEEFFTRMLQAGGGGKAPVK